MSPLPSFLAGTSASVGVEIAADRVSAVSLIGDGSGLSGYGTERLAPGVVTPAMNATNIHDRTAVAAALKSAFDKLGSHPRRVALVIPDTAAKISLLRFEKVPAAGDLDQLIRWQVRKAAPFKPEDSVVSWVPGVDLPGGGREFIVTQARRDIVASYEAACEEAGAQAGVVDLATLNLINAVIASGPGGAAGPGGDWLVIHVTNEYGTLAIVRGDDLIFIRTRAAVDATQAVDGAAAEGPADLTDLVHQTAMYHEDRLEGAQFSRVILSGGHGSGLNMEQTRHDIEERLGVRVEALDLRAAASLRDRLRGTPDLIDTLAPALGIVLRERVA
jgi:Tfp pilus assembly PilM family ATPase